MLSPFSIYNPFRFVPFRPISPIVRASDILSQLLFFSLLSSALFRPPHSPAHGLFGVFYSDGMKNLGIVLGNTLRPLFAADRPAVAPALNLSNSNSLICLIIPHSGMAIKSQICSNNLASPRSQPLNHSARSPSLSRRISKR